MHWWYHSPALLYGTTNYLKGTDGISSARWETPCILWILLFHYRVHSSQPFLCILSLTQSTPSHSILSSILILSSHQLLGLLSGLFPSDFPTTMLYMLYFSPYMWHAPSISSIGSPEWYLVSVYHGALRYAVFSSLVLLPPPYALYISSSAPCSWTFPPCIIPLTFRHRASWILGQALHYSPENAFYIFNQQYISLSDICLTVHHWYK